jgi:hypothetical protein
MRSGQWSRQHETSDARRHKRDHEMTNATKHKPKGYQLVPMNPTYKMLKAMAGEPLILAANEEAELRQRYFAMLKASPVK